MFVLSEKSDAGALSPSETTWTLEFPNGRSVSLQHDASHVASDGSDKTGLTLWSSALAMATHLDAHLPSLSASAPSAMEDAANTTTTTTSNATASSNDMKSNSNDATPAITTLELGAGLGLPSIVLARHGNSGDVVRHAIATDCELLPHLISLTTQTGKTPKRTSLSGLTSWNRNDSFVAPEGEEGADAMTF